MILAVVIAALLSHTVHAIELSHFVSRPDIQAPEWIIDYVDDDRLQQGHYWFISPYWQMERGRKTHQGPEWTAPYIYDTDGGLIWSGVDITQHMTSHDLKTFEIDGQLMMSFVWGKANLVGNGYILDNTYNIRDILDMDGQSNENETKKFNMHELTVFDNGKRALMLTVPVKPELFPAKHNAFCQISWEGFREVDVRTGEVYFEWNARDHIALDESTHLPKLYNYSIDNEWEVKCTGDWDLTHINAVEKLDDGDYLLSIRHTDTVYKISGTNGSIVWRLGGKYSDFVFNEPDARFSRQHQPRFHSQNETHTMISLFDNAIDQYEFGNASSDASRGLLLALETNVSPMRATLVAKYEKPWGGPYIEARGSMTYLPNGNAFVGWAVKGLISEHTPDGELLMSAMLDFQNIKSYRTYKLPWVGKPAQPPDVIALAENADGKDSTRDLNTVAYVSWNGATEVATWKLYQSDNTKQLNTFLDSSPRQGFETKLTWHGLAQQVIVVAEDSKGNEIGRSNLIHVQMPAEQHSEDAVVHSWYASSTSGSREDLPIEMIEWVSLVMLAVMLCYIGIKFGLRCRRARSGIAGFSLAA